jgi:para-aminobenzoate synthetase component 1
VFSLAELTSRIVPVALRGDPQAVYARLGPREHIALLESSKAMPGLSGWSCIAGPAFATLLADDEGATLQRVHDGKLLQTWADPFEAIREVASRLTTCLPATSSRPEGLGFVGGLVGYLGYDLARHVERLPSIAARDPDLPSMRLHLCDHVLAFDHATAQWHFCTTPWGDANDREAVWKQTLVRAHHEAAPTTFSAGPMTSRTSPDVYRHQVQQVLDFIAAGDIFQANLSHRLEGTFEGDPFALYQRLTALNPAPFSAYLQAEHFAIAGVSPERFLRLADGQISARPIKGTRSRGATPQQDQQQHDALVASEKDRAENLMIVDLMRNDLGRVARTGSVKVERLFDIEAHPSVWQMVSTITATLRQGQGPADLLRACWPPGSMTGAPKVRAMEIIDTLEPVRRGPYAGAIGYLDASGAMDWSVVIRTAVVHGGRVMVQVGGAVVSDSLPQAELDETFAKGRFLLEALRGHA